MDWKLEVVVIPVSDVDRAKAFYTDRTGFHGGRRLQRGRRLPRRAADPPGSACSITLMRNPESAGSIQGLHLVVRDIDAARAELADRGTAVSEIFHFEAGGQMPGHDPERRSRRSATGRE